MLLYCTIYTIPHHHTLLLYILYINQYIIQYYISYIIYIMPVTTPSVPYSTYMYHTCTIPCHTTHNTLPHIKTPNCTKHHTVTSDITTTMTIPHHHDHTMTIPHLTSHYYIKPHYILYSRLYHKPSTL